MSNRTENKAWLERESVRSPDGWESQMIELYGMEGALDMLAAQDGFVSEINLTHRPFPTDVELKEAVRAAREATFVLARMAYARWFADRDKAGADQ